MARNGVVFAVLLALIACASGVSAYTSSSSKSCATAEPGSLTLCADKNVTIEGSALVVNCVEGSALVVNGVDVLMTTSNLKAELLNTKAELLNTKAELADLKVKTTSELADLKAKVAALMLMPKPTTKAPAAKPTTKAPTAKAPTVKRAG